MSFTIPFAKHSDKLWRAVLWLSPLALLVGVWLSFKYDPDARLDVRLDRYAAIEQGRELAARQGIDVENWARGCRVEVDNDRYFLFRQPADAKTETLSTLAPEAAIHVRFHAPDARESYETWLAPNGRVLGFNHELPDKYEIADAGEAQARLKADEAMRLFAAANGGLQFGAPDAEDEREYARVERTYTYPLLTQEVQGLKVSRTVIVAGDQVLSERTRTEIDKQVSQHYIHRSQWRKLVIGIGGLAWGVLMIYGLIRYLQLSRQKEVPHARVLVLCFLQTVALLYVSYLVEFGIFDMPRFQGASLYVAIALGCVVLTLAMSTLAIVYGSGEGTLRETYTGKLTSLDALLTGRIASRNVARSILIGLGAGGWWLLLQQLPFPLYAATGRAASGLFEDGWKALMGEYATFMPITQMFFYGFQVAILGLLLPLSMFHRRARERQGLWLGLIILLSIGANLYTFNVSPVALPVGIWQACIATAILFLVFFKADLLAAMMAAGVLYLVRHSVLMVAQPAVSLRQTGAVSIFLAVLIFTFAFIRLRRGRTYTDAEVRPVYAGHLAERVLMQAEVSAAREAQIRLLPAHLPQIENLKIAAACSPARTVGGDFYDLFELSENRIGIFVAEGGERGLEAALTIAYAKGFLMPRFRTEASPSDVLCHLQTKIQPLLFEQRQLGIAYAILDSNANTLIYARTGSSPRIYVERANESEDGAKNTNTLHDGAMFERVERSLKFDNKDATECVIREARIEIGIGDSVLITTDGLTKLSSPDDTRQVPRRLLEAINGNGKGAKSRFKADIETSPDEAVGKLQTQLVSALNRFARQARRSGIEDDLTAVVIQTSERS